MNSKAPFGFGNCPIALKRCPVFWFRLHRRGRPLTGVPQWINDAAAFYFCGSKGLWTTRFIQLKIQNLHRVPVAILTMCCKSLSSMETGPVLMTPEGE